MLNNITSDMLTENPDSCKSNFGSHRVIAFMYRGMTDAEQENFRLAQKEQLVENAVRL